MYSEKSRECEIYELFAIRIAQIGRRRVPLVLIVTGKWFHAIPHSLAQIGLDTDKAPISMVTMVPLGPVA